MLWIFQFTWSQAEWSIIPFLSTLYIDNIFSELKHCGFGCYIGNLFSEAFRYTDDIELLVPTIYALNKLYDIM